MGRSELRVGNIGDPFISSDKVFEEPVFGGGFFNSDPVKGRYVSIRRVEYNSGWNYLAMNRLIAYRVPNLLEFGATILPGTSAGLATFLAQNLVENINRRSCGNNFKPFVGLDTQATFDSCFKTSQIELGPQGHIMVVGIDLQHSHV